MSSKDKIIELLKKYRERYLSGEEIAGALGVSRTAVWKAIKSLQRDGYEIRAVTNRGYILCDDGNSLSCSAFLPYLVDSSFASRINVFKSLESTNNTAKAMAVNGCEHGTVIIADTQTSGKGRNGRYFYSPPGSGLYISFVLRPKYIALQDTSLVTIAAAVTVCKAIQKLTGTEPTIKWVNDILLDEKKICGILSESGTSLEGDNSGWIIVGIGINIYTTDFANGLNHIAASILPESAADVTLKNRLGAELINTILSSNDWVNNRDVLSEYKKRMMLFGRMVTVYNVNEEYKALAVDINDKGHLIVKKDNGELTALSSGEVSIRI